MKTVANRLIVFAASALAFGTVAYGQTRMTAEIPFAFHTATGTMPAGTYSFSKLRLNGAENMISVQNTATHRTLSAGMATVDVYRRTDDPARPVLKFLCLDGDCSLKAIISGDGSLVYQTPQKSSAKETVVSLPMKLSNGD